MFFLSIYCHLSISVICLYQYGSTNSSNALAFFAGILGMGADAADANNIQQAGPVFFWLKRCDSFEENHRNIENHGKS